MPMADGMNIDRLDNPVPSVDDAALQQRLAGEDQVLSATRPILRHLLANRDESLFSDEVIARVRGITAHVAQQLLQARALAERQLDPGAFADELQQELAALLFEDVAFLSHVHALTLEAKLADQIRRRSGIDHVLSPLLQELAASADDKMAAAAIRAIASQARFIQQMRRMEMPLGELPGDLFHKALLCMRGHAGDNEAAAKAEAELRASYDEAESRLGQLTRLVMSMGRNAVRALAVDHAGLAVFATGLAMASGQDRNLTILSFGENQLTRLAVSMRAAGMRKDAVEEQFLYIHPDGELPPGVDLLNAEKAAAMLADSGLENQA